MRDGGSFDLTETAPCEKPGGKGQHEHAAYAQVPRCHEERVDDCLPDAMALATPSYRYGPDLGEIFPHHVQRAAADDRTVFVLPRDPKLLHILVQRHRVLAEKPTGIRVGVDEPADRAHVGRPGAADCEFHRRPTLHAGSAWRLGALVRRVSRPDAEGFGHHVRA